jgi:sterol desaturase/sphingolipid hydroxylase (fatty acid hydroxylase superfamily)
VLMVTMAAPPGAQQLISAAVIGGGLLILVVAEVLWPLRRTVEPKIRRIVRNLTTGGVSLAILTLLQAPLLVPVAQWAEQRGFGLMHAIAWPVWVELAVAVLLLDYTLWWWHWANHKVPFLWRFHLPHHVDLDLDASTALRFHFGELTLSIAYRCAQIVLIGTTTYTLWVWQTILFASILFHHSNLRLPLAFERWLLWLIVTPRMHGIHHSTRLNETNSNWSSLVSWWDFLHRTLLLNVPQQEIIIGVPAYQDRRDVTIDKVLSLPFRRQRADWHLPDGQLSWREHTPLNRLE